MPIDRGSDRWQNGTLIDRLGTNIGDNLLLENPEQAYTIEEIVEWVQNTCPETIPRPIRENDRDAAVIALVRAVLDQLDRRNFIRTRYVDEDGTGQLYYAHQDGDDALYPSRQLEHEVVPRLEAIEEDVDDLRAEIRDHR